MTPQLRNITTVTLKLRCELHDTDLENSIPSMYPSIVVQKDWRLTSEGWSFDLSTMTCPKHGQEYGNECKEHWRVWYHPTQGS